MQQKNNLFGSQVCFLITIYSSVGKDMKVPTHSRGQDIPVAILVPFSYRVISISKNRFIVEFFLFAAPYYLLLALNYGSKESRAKSCRQIKYGGFSFPHPISSVGRVGKP